MPSVVKADTHWQVRLPIPQPWGWPEKILVKKVMPDMDIALCYRLPDNTPPRVAIPLEVIHEYYRKEGAKPLPGELSNAQVHMLFALREGEWDFCFRGFTLNTARALRRRLLVEVDDKGAGKSRVRLTKEGERRARYLRGE
jgi:hypothetical protein